MYITGIHKVNLGAQVVPIPVVKVVSEVGQLSQKYQVTCIKVLGYGP